MDGLCLPPHPHTLSLSLLSASSHDLQVLQGTLDPWNRWASNKIRCLAITKAKRPGPPCEGVGVLSLFDLLRCAETCLSRGPWLHGRPKGFRYFVCAATLCERRRRPRSQCSRRTCVWRAKWCTTRCHSHPFIVPVAYAVFWNQNSTPCRLRRLLLAASISGLSLVPKACGLHSSTTRALTASVSSRFLLF